MNEFILYFIEKNDETILVYEEKRVIIKENYKRVIEIECLKKLITYKGRIEALRKRIGNGYNIPIFISNKICFIKVGKIYWVNYFKIKCVLKNGDVVLINGEVIKGGYSYRTIVKKIKLIKDLLIEQKYS